MFEQQLQEAVKLYNTGLFSEALTTLLLCDINDEEEDFLFYYYIGLCYIKLGDLTQGRENLEKYLIFDDNLLRIFQCRMLLSYVLIKTNDLKSAQEHLDNLLESGYESAKLYSLSAYIFYKKNMIAKSVKYYRKALAIDPENANALNALGYILSQYQEDLKEAEFLCRRALSIDVDNPAYLDSLGVVCLKNKKYTASVSFLDRAIQLAPDNNEIKEHINDLNRVWSGM